jgi:hypothetical protein
MTMSKASGSTCPALALLAATGCGLDIDLGSTEGAAPPSPTPPPSVVQPPCAIEDPALLQPPDRCFPFVGRSSHNGGPWMPSTTIVDECFVTADQVVRDIGPDGTFFPLCPTGVYWRFFGTFPPVENIERAVTVLAPWLTGTRLKRTIELFPDKNAIFIRFNMRDSNREIVSVELSHRAFFYGTGAPEHFLLGESSHLTALVPEGWQRKTPNPTGTDASGSSPSKIRGAATW